MNKLFLPFILSSIGYAALAQGPAITSWLQNTTKTGNYYPKTGTPTLTPNNILVNCQKVEYSSTSVYVHTKGIPSYPVGPYLDGNTNQAGDQSAIFKFPLTPTQNTGTPTATTLGNIGVFINGVALFDFQDGVAWNNTTKALCGGPGNPPCGTAGKEWTRDAVLAEMKGFDCAKGHPAGTNYHHHQNPTAFKLDKTAVSTVCNLYDSDGLYVLDETKHSPLIGYAYDGFPIYGAYAYKNTDGTGGITRMKSSYRLKTMTTRTNGPDVSTTYPLGYFREDYEFVANTDPDYLDVHNGRVCKTPEYPAGIYCYFATVDANHNSFYPYVIGPTFYGVHANRKVTTVTETTTEYKTSTGGSSILESMNSSSVSIFPNPSAEFIAIQVKDLVKEDLHVTLTSIDGKELAKTQINKGQTASFLNVQTLYNGVYFVKISDGISDYIQKVEISR